MNGRTTTFATIFTIAFIANNSTQAAEGVQGAVVTRTEGEASIFMKKNGAAPADTKAIMFEKEAYQMRPLKKGDRPGNGDLITTGHDGKVRLIFRNGDQVTVTPGTAYKFSWDNKSDKSALAEIVYGDIRAVIQPGGPRSGMQVKTKSSVMGVRGTDFYASAWSNKGGSKVAVIRGKVAVAAATVDGVNSKESEVTAGTTGTIGAPPSPRTPNSSYDKIKSAELTEIVVEKTSKEQLVVIQKDSKVAMAAPTQKKADVSESVQAELATLEKQAVETTMDDIKKNDPALYESLSKTPNKGQNIDSDVIQSESVKKIFVSAPSEVVEPKQKKPTLQDLESGDDIYEKYKWEKH